MWRCCGEKEREGGRRRESVREAERERGREREGGREGVREEGRGEGENLACLSKGVVELNC